MLIEMDKNQNRNNKANANSVKVSKTNFTKENGMDFYLRGYSYC